MPRNRDAYVTPIDLHETQNNTRSVKIKLVKNIYFYSKVVKFLEMENGFCAELDKFILSAHLSVYKYYFQKLVNKK